MTPTDPLWADLAIAYIGAMVIVGVILGIRDRIKGRRLDD